MSLRTLGRPWPRRPWLPSRRWPILVCVLLLLLGLWNEVPGLRMSLRERAVDILLPAFQSGGSGATVHVVDIDRDTLDRFGGWPWPRARLAQLVQAVADSEPSAIGLDILLAGPDRFAEAATSGDIPLRQALSSVPSVLGFALAPVALETETPATPILIGGTPRFTGLWSAAGVVGPTPMLAEAARGFGALVAAADPDGPVRRVPLLVRAGTTLRPGLAVELVRVAAGASAIVLGADAVLRVGPVTAPAGEDAALRLHPERPERWAERTISAATIMADPRAALPLKGGIVLIGASAPEAGGLRVTPASAATPSVQIQAAAVTALLRGNAAARPRWIGHVELAVAAVLGIAALWLAARLRPAVGCAVIGLLAVAWGSAALAAAPAAALLLDPAGPVAAMLLTFAAAALARFAQEEWRARLLRASFEQHLAPEVVRRIATNPTGLRLAGELRDVTALFTDIEGFTAMTEAAAPADLIAILDDYFDVVTRAVMEHGGMIDKIVGDAVHAIFNAPLELPSHPARAIDCALAILVASESVRTSARGQRIGLGRTRIGIETGPAIVGDVGGPRKLDYTAHGNAVNAAARLEAANKQFGSSICIGPGAAARVDPTTLRRLGRITLRGRSEPVDVFTPAVLARPDR